MKKLFTLFFSVCLTCLTLNASNYNYLCGITSISIDTLASSTKHQFTVTFEQKCKNTAEYSSKPTTSYTSTVKVVLNSDDNTLEGVYTTEGASATSSSANVNDQTINLVTSEFTSGSTTRVLHPDSLSTFVINKISEHQYSISACRLCFATRVSLSNTYVYNYSYNADEILNQGIGQTPYVFGYSDEYVEQFYSYDLTVTGLSIKDSTSDYGENRYFLTMQCSGSNRETNEIRNYEVQLALYTEGAEPTSIVGSYATKNGSKLMWSSNCYVKDLKTPKQRYLSNDSVSSITIVSTGTNTYNFSGGPLICTDLDMNYLAVTGNRRIEATHYYYFNSNNGGQGIDFSFDGENASLTPSGATGIENTESRSNARKISREGVVYIERNGQLYNLQGALIQ